MSELERLRTNTAKLVERGCVDIKFTWAEDAHLRTVEERAKAVNDALEAVERGEYTEMEPIGDSRRGYPAPEQPTLGPALRSMGQVPSLHRVVLDHFTGKPEQGDGR